jgi:hypothetical protein
LAESSEIQDRFSERFAGDGAGIGTNAANDFLAFDDTDFLAELGGLDGSLLAGRPTPYDEKIVLTHQASCL